MGDPFFEGLADLLNDTAALKQYFADEVRRRPKYPASKA